MYKMSKKLLITAIVILAIIIAALLYFLFGMGTPLKLPSVEAKNGDITEEINLAGQVKASQGVDLAFETQGKIVANYVKVGDKIYAGQALLAIDSSLLQAQLKQAQAQLDALNIDTVKSKTDAGLQSVYATSLSAAQKSVSTAKDILLTITDLQNNHFKTENSQNIPLFNAKDKGVLSLLGQPNAILYTSEELAALNGGAFGSIQNAIQNPTQTNTDGALSAAKIALQDMNDLINAIPIIDTLSSAERNIISASNASINAEIITTSANIQAITSLKVNNSATITTTNAQIEGAQANINAIKTQISKTVIRALFDGQVDKDNAVVGQIMSSNVPVITISNNNLEIDTNIPEVDLSEAKVGNEANISLDAYGNNVNFPATIISVDSAPSFVNGIAAYGAKLKFKNSDDRIKPGMTANITVISDKHSNVLMIPISAVIQQNGKYFVIVDKGNSQKDPEEVTVGLRDGKNIEITSGLKSGEKVFAY